MNETIAAVSTPAGRGGIGIVRICGPESLRIAGDFVKLKNNAPLKPFSLRCGFIYDQEQLIDEVLISYMGAQRSYTRQDTVEINCHGGIAVVQKALSLAIKAGARLAQPGEFTKLAFLNGRIDLSQAEAVMDLINAESDYALASAAKQLSGSVKEKISQLRSRVIDIQARIEVAIDYPEYEDADRSEVVHRIAGIMEELRHMASMANLGRTLAYGVRTAIVGCPNTGKSSLLNALLEQERAIVTDIPGTTRDVLSEKLHVGPLVLNLMDTAGIRESSDEIERMGIEKTLTCAREADLTLWVIDSSRDLQQDDFRVWEAIQDNKNIIGILNKNDLPVVLSKETAVSQFKIDFFCISARYSQGFGDIKNHITRLFSAGDISPGDLLTSGRHKQAAENAALYLSKALESAESGLPDDFISIELTEVISALGEITGENASSDLIDRVFSSFCVGK